MRPAVPEELPLACPACLAGGAGGERSALTLTGCDLEGPGGAILHGALTCAEPGCARSYPIIDGVPLLVRDLPGYLVGEREQLLRRRDLPAWADTLLDLHSQRGRRARERRSHRESYLGHLDPTEPRLHALGRDLRDFVEGALDRHAAAGGLGLDMGAATGGFTRSLARRTGRALGIELRFDCARAARERDDREEGAAYVVADAELPPLRPGRTQVVLALNLLDATRCPRAVLAAAHRVLAPGGVLVLTTPFSPREETTPLAEQVEEHELRGLLEGGAPTGLWPGFEILEERDGLAWHLPITRRRHHVFICRGIVARKRGETPDGEGSDG
jgi:SAM-dependent methyltransferase/uncharacterized protein YbaR (Trm112 family)